MKSGTNFFFAWRLLILEMTIIKINKKLSMICPGGGIGRHKGLKIPR